MRLEDDVRRVLDPAEPGLLWVHRHPGMRAHARLAGALADEPVLHFNAPSLPDGDARAAWAGLVRERLGVELDGGLAWTDLVEGVASPRPVTLVFDGVAALMDAHRAWGREVGTAWNRLRTGNAPVHLVLVDADARILEDLRGPGGAFRHPSETLRPDLAGPPGAWATLRAGDFGTLARHCPDWSARDVALAWSVLGASDAVLDHIDPGQRASTNIRRLLLVPGAPLWDLPLTQLRTRFQSPARYAGVLRALARGGREWKDLVHGLSGELSANAVAPYVGRLRDQGAIEDLVSLDAPVRSRRRRYRLADPLLGFWWAQIAPRRDDLLGGSVSPEEAWAALRGGIDARMETLAGRLLADALLLYGRGLLGAVPREIGGLWGDGYDLPVATTLTNGAMAYGDVAWGREEQIEDAFDRIEAGLRFTRYGYGREARLRVVLTATDPAPEHLRRVRRDPLRRVVTLDDAVRWAREA